MGAHVKKKKKNVINLSKCSQNLRAGKMLRVTKISQIANNLQRSICSSPILSQSFNVQDQEDFQKRVLKSTVPIIVDFHAKWCGPCKIIGPRLETLANKNLDKFHLAKVDIDNVPELAEEFNVTAVPSVMAIKDGVVVASFVGVLDDDKLKIFVNKLIGE